MLEVLRDCGALARLLPEVDRLWGVPQRPEYHPEVDTGAHLLLVLDQAARLQAPLPARFAALCHDLGKGTTPPEEWPRHIAHEARSERLTRELCSRLKPPSECSELALVVAREHTHIHQAATFGAAAVLRLLERCDAFRRPERFELALLACEADARGRLGLEHADYPSAPLLRQALQAGLDVDTARWRPKPRPAAPRARRSATPSTWPAPTRWPWPSEARPGSDQQPDHAGDQPQHHAAGQRQEELAAEQAQPDVARQAAQADLLQPFAGAVEDQQGDQEDQHPAHRVLPSEAVGAVTLGEADGVQVQPRRPQGDHLEQLAHLVLVHQLERHGLGLQVGAGHQVQQAAVEEKRAWLV
jgi:hypothetical protein